VRLPLKQTGYELAEQALTQLGSHLQLGLELQLKRAGPTGSKMDSELELQSLRRVVVVVNQEGRERFLSRWRAAVRAH